MPLLSLLLAVSIFLISAPGPVGLFVFMVSPFLLMLLELLYTSSSELCSSRSSSMERLINNCRCHADVVVVNAWWLDLFIPLLVSRHPQWHSFWYKTLGEGCSGTHLTVDEHMTQRHHLLYCLEMFILSFYGMHQPELTQWLTEREKLKWRTVHFNQETCCNRKLWKIDSNSGTTCHLHAPW